MTYGWKRAEILGAVMNGCFLLALCLYILLESIPRFIAPPPEEEGVSWIFISVSGAGLFVNLVGTIVFAGLSFISLSIIFSFVPFYLTFVSPFLFCLPKTKKITFLSRRKISFFPFSLSFVLFLLFPVS